MKKILSIALVLCMMFAMAITANAATTGTLSLEASANEVTVGDEFTVTVKYAPGADSSFKGGTVRFNWDYAAGLVEAVGEVEGLTGFTTNNVNFRPANNVYAVQHTAAATDDWVSYTEEGIFTVVKFNALKAGTFTISAGTGTNVTFADASNTDRLAVKSAEAITITIKEDAPAFTPVTVKGDVVEGTDNVVLEKDPATAYQNTYEGTAVFEATLGADVKYGEAGFIWVANDTESANKFTVDASVIAGGGTFEYAVAMYAIPAGVDIDAIPYYVTAE